VEELQHKTMKEELAREQQEAKENDISLVNDVVKRDFSGKASDHRLDEGDYVRWSDDDYMRYRQEEQLRKKKTVKEENHGSDNPYYNENGELGDEEMV